MKRRKAGESDGETLFLLTCLDALPRPEKTVVIPFCAGTCRRERFLDSFSSERSSGLDSDSDRQAEQSNNFSFHMGPTKSLKHKMPHPRVEPVCYTSAQ